MKISGLKRLAEETHRIGRCGPTHLHRYGKVEADIDGKEDAHWTQDGQGISAT